MLEPGELTGSIYSARPSASPSRSGARICSRVPTASPAAWTARIIIRTCATGSPASASSTGTCPATLSASSARCCPTWRDCWSAQASTCELRSPLMPAACAAPCRGAACGDEHARPGEGRTAWRCPRRRRPHQRQGQLALTTPDWGGGRDRDTTLLRPGSARRPISIGSILRNGRVPGRDQPVRRGPDDRRSLSRLVLVEAMHAQHRAQALDLGAQLRDLRGERWPLRPLSGPPFPVDGRSVSASLSASASRKSCASIADSFSRRIRASSSSRSARSGSARRTAPRPTGASSALRSRECLPSGAAAAPNAGRRWRAGRSSMTRSRMAAWSAPSSTGSKHRGSRGRGRSRAGCALCRCNRARAAAPPSAPASRARLACGVKGMWPDTISWTCGRRLGGSATRSRAAARLIRASSARFAAAPSLSRSSPSRRCSVPM